LIEGDSSWELCNAYIFNDSEREHSIRCDADGVTVITIQRKYYRTKHRRVYSKALLRPRRPNISFSDHVIGISDSTYTLYPC